MEFLSSSDLIVSKTLGSFNVSSYEEAIILHHRAMQLLSRKQILLSYWAATTTTTILEPSPPSSTLSSLTNPQRRPYDAWARAIRNATTAYLQQQSTNVTAGALIRLAFHDATTSARPNNGSIRYELQWSENRALAQPLAVVQAIHDDNRNLLMMDTKSNRNNKDKNAVVVGSFADTLALVATQAIEYAGGPSIAIRLGRVDSDTADPYLLATPLMRDTPRSRVTQTMPNAGLDSDGLRLYFQQHVGLTQAEFVALSGLHGLGRHVSLLGMDKGCLRNLTRVCLEDAPVLLPFVTASVDKFSNAYFCALLQWNARQVELGQVAFIPTDVALVVDAGLRRHVERFARDEVLYERTLARAWQRLMEGSGRANALTRERY